MLEAVVRVHEEQLNNCALILSETLALYKSFTCLLTYLFTSRQ